MKFLSFLRIGLLAGLMLNGCTTAKPDPLLNTQWQFVKWLDDNTTRLPISATQKITFSRDLGDNKNWFDAYDGCNHIYGEYEIDGKTLNIGDKKMAITTKFCTNDDKSPFWNDEFRSALAGTTAYEIKGTQLFIFTDNTRTRYFIFHSMPFTQP